MIQQRIDRTKVQDVNDLRERQIDVWAGEEQLFIDHAINQWRRRLHN